MVCVVYLSTDEAGRFVAGADRAAIVGGQEWTWRGKRKGENSGRKDGRLNGTIAEDTKERKREERESAVTKQVIKQAQASRTGTQRREMERVWRAVCLRWVSEASGATSQPLLSWCVSIEWG